jgi:hypothetical protein
MAYRRLNRKYRCIDDELEGGALKFRPKYASQDNYGIETDNRISSVQTSAAIVFSNSIPHCYQQIRSLTHEDEAKEL